MNQPDEKPALVSKGHGDNRAQIYFPGTLRDWFAGQALMGLIARTDVTGQVDSYARISYGHADAMLKQREAKS